MTFLNAHTRRSTVSKNDIGQPMGRQPTLMGVYMGYIKDTTDVQKNGRLRVWIPELGSAPDNDDAWLIVNYCSPFAGATNVDTISEANVQTFEGTQTSYGMWMIPPDINNIVAVMFINGDPSRGIWIGCLLNQYMNNMIPGMASSTNNYQYPGKNIPVAEYNKWDPKASIPDNATKPYEATKFKGLGNQGLINDPVRGTTSSSARRESPSGVFGIITPGPIINSNVSPENVRRKGGSSFIMDDGNGSEYVQLATKTGAQIRIDETNGFIYLINRDGTAWVQMDKTGNIDIFGANSISMRSQQDFNIRADGNINLEAGQNVFIKAAMDTTSTTTTFTYDVNNAPITDSQLPLWQNVGEGNGTGGNIVMQALNDWQSTTKNSAFLTVIDNNMNIDIGNSYALTTQAGGQDFNSYSGIKLTTGAAFDLAAVGNIRAGSDGSVSVVAGDDIVLCTSSNLNFKSASDIQIASGGDTLLAATNFDVTAETLFSDTVGITGGLSAGGSAMIVGSITLGGSLGVAGDLSVAGAGHLIADSAILAESFGTGSAPSVPTPPTPPTPAVANPAPAQNAISANLALPSQVKPLNSKINILATWADSTPNMPWIIFSVTQVYQPNTIVQYTDSSNNVNYYSANIVQGPGPFNASNWTKVQVSSASKFKRNSQAVQTTVSRLATYEPCPEHAAFKLSSVAAPIAPITVDDSTYQGSNGAGNTAPTSQPPAAVAPGVNNTTIKGDPPTANTSSNELNVPALQCQLSIHEGIRYSSYLDSRGLLTGGIGHLLRKNEIAQFPNGSPISQDQVTTWFQQDVASAISIAQNLVSSVWGSLSDIRKRAVCDLAYNLGKGGLSKFVQFLAAMNSSNFNEAAQQLRSSAWFTQVGKRGPDIITMIAQDTDPNGCDKKFPPTDTAA